MVGATALVPPHNTQWGPAQTGRKAFASLLPCWKAAPKGKEERKKEEKEKKLLILRQRRSSDHGKSTGLSSLNNLPIFPFPACSFYLVVDELSYLEASCDHLTSSNWF